ncbi:MAG: lamin tail domain-containing protein [Bacteroidota bacterium]
MKYLIILLATSLLLIGCSKNEDESLYPPTPSEPVKVYIYSVTSTPTTGESITIKNNYGSTQDITAWTLGDKNDPTAYKIPVGTILIQGGMKTFSRSTIGFQINDSGEILYLKNKSGSTIDTWSN